MQRSLWHLETDLKERSCVKIKDSKAGLNVFLMHPIPHALCSFLFLVVHSSVDINALFRPERMHVFSFGISEELKECLIVMLVDSKRTSSAINDSQTENKSLWTIGRKVIHCLNSFPRNAECLSSASVCIDFSKAHEKTELIGFSIARFNRIAQSFWLQLCWSSVLFLGDILDIICGIIDQLQVTKRFT